METQAVSQLLATGSMDFFLILDEIRELMQFDSSNF
jgi:hypothetical protein